MSGTDVGSPVLPSGLVILIVEDDEDVRATTVSICQSLGFVVVTARHGREALRALKTHANIALMFTDIRMPEMDGLDLVKEARKLRPGLKIVMTSGYVTDEPKGLSLPLVRKPFRAADLAKAFKSLLGDG